MVCPLFRFCDVIFNLSCSDLVAVRRDDVHLKDHALRVSIIPDNPDPDMDVRAAFTSAAYLIQYWR
mgnify:CR=1 FL=1